METGPPSSSSRMPLFQLLFIIGFSVAPHAQMPSINELVIKSVFMVVCDGMKS